jgi:hypothetical protein
MTRSQNLQTSVLGHLKTGIYGEYGYGRIARPL